MKKYIVYCHTLKKDGRKYVGITCQKPRVRWHYGNGYRKNTHIRNAIDKYGWDSFEHTILFEDLTEQEAKDKEIELIEKWQLRDRTKGFNICIGGGGTNGCNKGRNKGFHLTKETKEKLRQVNLGKKQSMETIEKRNQKIYIKVDMLSLEGEYLRTFPSIKEASIFVNGSSSHITEVCKGQRLSANNYKWRYSL